jgi:dual specificity phosphatase 3
MAVGRPTGEDDRTMSAKIDRNRELPTRLLLANADFVTTQLLTGGDLAVEDNELAEAQLRELVARGLTHIVDVRIEWSDQYFVAQLAPEINYLHVGIDDAGQRVPYAFFDTAVGFIREALTDPSTMVLTHCHMGINRGPSLAYAVLMDQGWDPVEALDAITEARPIAFLAYADDALRWRHARTDASSKTRRTEQQALAAWRARRNRHLDDVLRLIRPARTDVRPPG